MKVLIAIYLFSGFSHSYVLHKRLNKRQANESATLAQSNTAVGRRQPYFVIKNLDTTVFMFTSLASPALQSGAIESLIQNPNTFIQREVNIQDRLKERPRVEAMRAGIRIWSALLVWQR
jgi:hypothetical protein